MQPLAAHHRPALLEIPLDVLSADLTIPQALWDIELDDYASYELIYASLPSPALDLAPYTRPYALLEVSLDVDVDFTLELEAFDLLELS